MTSLLDGWQGQMDGDSVPASVFAYTTYFFTKSIFHMWDIEQTERFRLTEKAGYPHFSEAMVKIFE